MVDSRPRIDGRFELLEMVGRGGMGRVYRAVDVMTGKTVALKQLVPELAADARMLARWHSEAQALASLRLRGIPRLIAEGVHEGVPFIAMEWFPGVPLAEAARAPHALTLGHAAELVGGLLEVMAEMHDEGWVHGDIKTANVLIGDDQRVMLVDFGLARHARPDDALHVVDEVCGTPEYMAPELVAGAPASVTTDLYAVGALIYELMAGAPPFGGSSAESIVLKQMFGLPVPPSQHPGAHMFAPAFDDVVRRALHKDPGQRFASARQMRSAVEAAVRASQERNTMTVGTPPQPDVTRPLDFADEVPVCRAHGARPTRAQLAQALIEGHPDEALDAYLRLAHRMAVTGDHDGARRELMEAIDVLTLGGGAASIAGPDGLWRAIAELAALEDHAGRRSLAVALAHEALRRAYAAHSIEGTRRCAWLCRRMGVEPIRRAAMEVQRPAG